VILYTHFILVDVACLKWTSIKRKEEEEEEEKGKIIFKQLTFELWMLN
jgi:hypothetical protein